MKRIIVIFFMFFTCISLNAQNYSISGDSLELEFNLSFGEENVYMPQHGFLHDPFNSEKNIYLYEFQEKKLIVYNFPTPEYIQQSRLNADRILKWNTIWNLEKQKIYDSLKARVKMRVSDFEILKIETIEIRMVYYVNDCKDFYLLPDKIKYKVITFPLAE